MRFAFGSVDYVDVDGDGPGRPYCWKDLNRVQESARCRHRFRDDHGGRPRRSAATIALDRDRYPTDAAPGRLADLGFPSQVVNSSSREGVSAEESSRVVPNGTRTDGLAGQLAPSGELLVHLTSASPFWLAAAIVKRTSACGPRRSCDAFRSPGRTRNGADLTQRGFRPTHQKPCQTPQPSGACWRRQTTVTGARGRPQTIPITGSCGTSLVHVN